MPLPTNISEATRRLNPHLFGGPAQAQPVTATTPAMPDAKRLRQKSGPKLNKTEQAFLDHLMAAGIWGNVRAQSVTLVLANGVRYTPDFVDLDAKVAWETKGFMRDDAAVKIKLAASLYPEIRFHLVTRKRMRDGGGWAIQHILP